MNPDETLLPWLWARVALLAAVGVLLGFALNPAGLREDLSATPGAGGVTDPFVSLDDALHWHRDGAALLIDARAGEDFAAAHPVGALPWRGLDGADLSAAIRPWLFGHQRLVVYDGGTGDYRDLMLAAELRSLGHPSARALAVGLEAWTEAGGPTASGFDVADLLQLEDPRR